jgi:hypothetical protein
MAEMTNPWWYSGDADDREPESPEHPEAPGSALPSWDPAVLVSAANQLVEWATERFVTPHAEHGNPADHPTCVLCRGAAVLGATPRPENTGSQAPITWVPVRRVND